MQLISDITRYITIFFIMLIILILILGVVAYYLLKVKKVASKEEMFDYSRFERRDSIDYIRFDQIINSTENGVPTKNGLIVTHDGSHFIAGLKVNGYNFFTASAQEQHQSMKGMISFLQTVEGDIQYRQSTKAIDLSFNIEEHRKRLKEVELEIYGLNMDHQDMVERAEEFVDNPSIFSNYEKKILEIEKTINCKKHTRDELSIVIQYMEALTDNNLECEKVQCWLFEWSYNPNDYTEELSKEEQYEKAAQALATKASSYIAALQRTGCTCERMNADEILELFRYHYSPITADAYKMPDLYNSSYNALYVSSDSLDKLEREAKEEEDYRNLKKSIRDREEQERNRQEQLRMEEESRIRAQMEDALDDEIDFDLANDSIEPAFSEAVEEFTDTNEPFELGLSDDEDEEEYGDVIDTSELVLDSEFLEEDYLEGDELLGNFSFGTDELSGDFSDEELYDDTLANLDDEDEEMEDISDDEEAFEDDEEDDDETDGLLSPDKTGQMSLFGINFDNQL